MPVHYQNHPMIPFMVPNSPNGGHYLTPMPTMTPPPGYAYPVLPQQLHQGGPIYATTSEPSNMMSIPSSPLYGYGGGSPFQLNSPFTTTCYTDATGTGKSFPASPSGISCPVYMAQSAPIMPTTGGYPTNQTASALPGYLMVHYSQLPGSPPMASPLDLNNYNASPLAYNNTEFPQYSSLPGMNYLQPQQPPSNGFFGMGMSNGHGIQMLGGQGQGHLYNNHEDFNVRMVAPTINYGPVGFPSFYSNGLPSEPSTSESVLNYNDDDDDEDVNEDQLVPSQSEDAEHIKEEEEDQEETEVNGDSEAETVACDNSESGGNDSENANESTSKIGQWSEEVENVLAEEKDYEAGDESEPDAVEVKFTRKSSEAALTGSTQESRAELFKKSLANEGTEDGVYNHNESGSSGFASQSSSRTSIESSETETYGSVTVPLPCINENNLTNYLPMVNNVHPRLTQVGLSLFEHGRELPFVNSLWNHTDIANLKTNEPKYEYYVPPRVDDDDYFGGQLRIFALRFNEHFSKFLPSVWTLQAVPELCHPFAPDATWFQDNMTTKLRFCCRQCRRPWTSMRGKIGFFFKYDFPAGRGHAFIKIFAQVCNQESCSAQGFQSPACYPEEVDKVVWKLSQFIGYMYYKLPFSFDIIKTQDKAIRDGHPKSQHRQELCQACHFGVCSYGKVH